MIKLRVYFMNINQFWMKNLATSKNEICLIAGSGLFVYEVANYLNNKNLLNQIVLINENNLIKKKFKDKCKSFKINLYS